MSHSQLKHGTQTDSKILKWTIILASAAIGLVVDYLSPGWGRPVLLTLLIFGSLVFFCHPYWNSSFWMFITATFILHSALVLGLRRVINESSMPIVFLGAVAEIIVILVILDLVLPDKNQHIQH